ncbi:MAG: hypothetical protein IPJ88_14430 [Myxococcales bacterium]|nr:MAG: hypothetical protein IPJ88_14430 [Myxococcales bacterium]
MSLLPEESTSHERFNCLSNSLKTSTLQSSDELWEALGSHEGYPRSVCSHLATPQKPHSSRTCGAIVMDLSGGYALAASGCVHHSRPHYFDFE